MRGLSGEVDSRIWENFTRKDPHPLHQVIPVRSILHELRREGSELLLISDEVQGTRDWGKTGEAQVFEF